MAETAADVLIETLQDWGVDTIFGMPGDGINGIMEALRKRKKEIRFILVRHEEAAAFMACGYAKYTGRLGVCLATSGPGGIHLLNGLYDAKLDGAPVLALTGLQFHDLINTRTQQDVELDKLFMDVALYNNRIMGPAHVENVTDLACRTALSSRTISHITFPVDIQSQPMKKKNMSKRNIPDHTSDVFARGSRRPLRADVFKAASILKEGKKIAILAGQGANLASKELIQLSEKCAAPIVKALLGKSSVPDDHPNTTGGIGLLGSAPSQYVINHCDTLLMVGTSFPYIEYFPKPGQARGIQIDIDPTRIGLRYPVELGLVGDSATTLKEISVLLTPRKNRTFLKKARKMTKDWRRIMEKRGTRMDKPMKPQVVAWELGKRLKSNAIVSCDSGTITTWFARQIPVRSGQKFSLSGTLASMANGLPYTIAAQIAFPDRQCVAFVGDGGFSMLMAELATCVKYKLPVKIVVIKNNTLGQIRWEQMAFLGNPEYMCDLQPIDFKALALAFGVKGYSIDNPKECGSILDQALAETGPVLIEAIVDGLEPPMPAKVEFEQGKKWAKSMARGQQNRIKIIKTIMVDKVRELI